LRGNKAPFENNLKKEKRIVILGLLLILSTIWGLANVSIRKANFELSPINLTFLRWLVARANLIILPLFGKPKTKLVRRDIPLLILFAFLSVPVYHLLINFGIATVSAGVAGFLSSLGRIFIAALSAFILKEKIKGRLAIALFCGISGALVLSWPYLDFGSNLSFSGPAELMLAALALAVFVVLAKPLLQKYGAIPVTIWTGLIGTTFILPLLSPTFFADITHLSFAGWIAVLHISILSSVMGYLIFYSLVAREPVSKLSVQLYLIPIVSLLGGIFFLGEAVTTYTIVGGLIVLFSVVLISIGKD
jgi:drug/metabolite transporter (DMT)-like permease